MDKEYDKVSIIVPVYNVEDYLEECLDSICNQSYIYLEIILVDDGSIDSSGAICDRYKGLDNRIKVFHIENQGVSVARNIGIKNATGKYIQFVDSDDYLGGRVVEMLVKQIHDRDLAICSICMKNDYKILKGNRQTIDNKLLEYDGNCISISEYLNIMSSCMTDPFFGAPYNKLFRTKIIKENNIFFEEGVSFAEDFVFNLKYLFYVEKIGRVEKELYFYRRLLDGTLSRMDYDYEYMSARWELICVHYGKLYTAKNMTECYESVILEAYRYIMNSMLGKFKINEQSRNLYLFSDKKLCDGYDENKKVLLTYFSMFGSVRLYMAYRNMYYYIYYGARRIYRKIQFFLWKNK